MKTIALVPPKPPMAIKRREPDIDLCSSCDKPVNASGECAGCSD